jgi:hypothetical protein
MTRIILAVGGIIFVLGIVVYSTRNAEPLPDTTSPPRNESAPPSAQSDGMMDIRGTYVCLPLQGGGSASPDCAFGIRTDDNVYYAVNFGAGAGSMADFREGESVGARGTLILPEKLTPNHWAKFEMSGLFTILEKK